MNRVREGVENVQDAGDGGAPEGGRPRPLNHPDLPVHGSQLDTLNYSLSEQADHKMCRYLGLQCTPAPAQPTPRRIIVSEENQCHFHSLLPRSSSTQAVALPIFCQAIRPLSHSFLNLSSSTSWQSGSNSFEGIACSPEAEPFMGKSSSGSCNCPLFILRKVPYSGWPERRSCTISQRRSISPTSMT